MPAVRLEQELKRKKLSLNIIYRLCELETPPSSLRSGRPSWFSKANSLSNFLGCIEEFKNEIGEVVFVHDGPQGVLYEQLTNHKIDKINTLDNEKSLSRVYEIASEIRGTIYFVEDDYLHLPGSISTLFNGVKRFGLVTGYDHPDRYLREDDVSLGNESVAWDESTMRHWRTVESTTCTFAVREDILSAILPTLKLYLAHDRALFRKLIEVGLRLWSPIPGISTHLMQDFLGFGVNWQELQKRKPL
jgi:hypothetical protein